jgi:hypothetical protein
LPVNTPLQVRARKVFGEATKITPGYSADGRAADDAERCGGRRRDDERS